MAEEVPLKRCFFISPIGEDGSENRKKADQVVKHLLKKALGTSYEIARSDDEPNPGAITPTIVTSILEADLIIVDLSGANPNVYYELAIAHGYEKPTVHIQQANERIPFDLKDMRIVRYNLSDPDELELSQKKLFEYAAYAIENPEKTETPLSSAKRFAGVAASNDPVAESNVRVVEQIDALRREVRRALGSSRAGAVGRLSNQENSATIRAFRKIIENATERDALVPDDFEGAISPITPETFDRWARRMLAKVLGDPELSVGALNETLWDDETKAQASEVAGDEDDDPS